MWNERTALIIGMIVSATMVTAGLLLWLNLWNFAVLGFIGCVALFTGIYLVGSRHSAHGAKAASVVDLIMRRRPKDKSPTFSSPGINKKQQPTPGMPPKCRPGNWDPYRPE